MSDGFPRALTIIATVGAGLTAGVFFAFSTFVMTALGRLPPARGISAMQAINRAAPTPPFMTVLFGTGLACLALVVVAVPRLAEPAAVGVLIGAGLNLIGIVLTITYHVPRNEALATVDPAALEAAETWACYLRGWTTWNHVRTLTSVAATVAFAVALGAT